MRPSTARVTPALKKKEEEKKADTKKSSTATPSRTLGKASTLKPAAKPAPSVAKATPVKPSTAKARAALVSKPGTVAGKAVADPTKPKAAQSDWLVYLKLSGGPFAKAVKEAKIADCK